MAFYVFFTIYDGVVICVDSESYIGMYLHREPFYPGLIAIFRGLFGGLGIIGPGGAEWYLFFVVAFQGILTALCSWSMVVFLTREFKLNHIWELGCMFITLAPSLLCRFAAHRGSMYSNCIMTEGICIPLFILFARFILDYIFNHKRAGLVFASICSFVMISSRKQMYVTLVLLVGAIIFTERMRIRRTVLILLIFVLSILACNRGLESIYSLAVHGEQSSHFNDNRFLSTMIFYTAEIEDAERIEDKDIKDLFINIYTLCDSEGSMRHSAENYIDESAIMFDRARGLVNHFEDHYDMIQIDHMWPMIEEVAGNRASEYLGVDAGDSYEILKETYTDEINGAIISALLPATWTKIAAEFALSFAHGYVNTVAKSNRILDIYALIIGIVYIALLVRGLIKSGLTKTNIFALYTLAALIGNIALVSMVIFCQPRYMIYNMALFYISLVLMVKDILEQLSERRQKLKTE